MKLNFFALKKGMALLCIVSCFSFSKKNENVPGKTNMRSVTDTLIVNGEITSVTPVTLKDCPFPASDVFVKEEDLQEWDHNSIVKYTYSSGSIVSYFIKNNKDELKTLVIFYNPAESKQLKMLIAGKRFDESNIRYRFTSAEDVLHFDITVRDEKVGYNVNIGTAPDFKSLGNYEVYNEGRATLPCQGFSACLYCHEQSCSNSWLCSIACGIGSIFCLTGWIAGCSLNP